MPCFSQCADITDMIGENRLGLGGLVGETLRINTRLFNRIYYAIFGSVMRKHEVHDAFSGGCP